MKLSHEDLVLLRGNTRRIAGNVSGGCGLPNFGCGMASVDKAWIPLVETYWLRLLELV